MELAFDGVTREGEKDWQSSDTKQTRPMEEGLFGIILPNPWLISLTIFWVWALGYFFTRKEFQGVVLHML